MQHTHTIATVVLALLASTSLVDRGCDAGDSSPLGASIVELGRVRWLTDLDAGLAAAKSSGKPVFLLFQEIPGCATCRGFGNGPLSEPLMVEAIETLFTPVAIHNNRGGADEVVLKRFGEPAWNNPVVRLLDADGKDLVERRDGVWTTGGLAPRMVAALERAPSGSRSVPHWLRSLADEADTSNQQTAVFAMHCFWVGEATIGAIDGVISTRAGFVGGDEVVEVVFDPRRVGYAKLLEAANGRQCATTAYVKDASQRSAAKALGSRLKIADLASAPRAAPESDQKHALRATALRYVPLTPMQATKVNAAVAAGRSPDEWMAWLSPRQRELRSRIERALAADPRKLSGLALPEKREELAAYEATLRERLGA